jgi:hypothetical protein
MALRAEAAPPLLTGEQVYRQKCARCHGVSGEGSRSYPRVLEGGRSTAQLASLIAKTMPEDNPGDCVGDEARKVAAYIYDAFYSETARARAKPARIALSRLTVRQYQNTVADLIGTFRGAAQWGDQRGLHGEYFKGRNFRGSERAIDRVDPMVRFDFGIVGPDPAKFDPNVFSIRWEGSVLAPETGDYEFIVRTEHAARFWINDTRKPLIDAWVKSGTDTEHRETIRLLAGRVYPVRLEFSKAKQGVDDSKKNKDKKEKPPEIKASIALEWKLPHRVAEVIPDRNLSTAKFAESFVLATAFPPDDRSAGYERGSSISKAWDQATTDAAIEVADYVANHLRDLTGVSSDAKDREPKYRAFCRLFAERAFRRPLGDEQAAFFIDRQFKASADPETAVKRVILLVLKSPRFLYREAGAENDGYAIASRLAFALWDSLPDGPLLEAAAKGQLRSRDEVRKQAERMAGDLRTRAKVRAFFQQWLKVESVPDLSKDPKLFPEFNDAVISDLRTTLDLFLDDVIWSGSSDFRQLLVADTVYVNGRLAKLYGGGLPADAPFKKLSLEPRDRAGLLTHPYLMACFAYTGSTSPIHRGVFIVRSLLGRGLRPPPEAVAPLAPELHANLTTRERVTLQTSPKACTTCHGMVNPLGFGLEHFDAIGRYRSEEKGRTIDATGVYETRTGELRSFSGARELGMILAASDETHHAFVEQLFHYVVKQPIRAFGPQTTAELTKKFAEHDFSIRNLLVEIATTSALPNVK